MYIYLSTWRRIGFVEFAKLFSCEKQLQIVLRLNNYFMDVLYTCNTKSTAVTVSFSSMLSCEILDLGQQLSVCANDIIEGKATE